MNQPRITILAPGADQVATPGDQPLSGLGAAAAAYQAAGLNERLEAFGGVIDSVVRPTGNDLADPIEALGAFNAEIASAVAEARSRGSLPLLTGGTCRHLPGMIAGLQQSLPRDTRLGLLWLDAHGDFNTPNTTRSGMLGGMPVAVVAGLCHSAWREGAGMTAPIPTDRIMMVDVRNLDPEEEQLIRATDVRIVKAQEPDALQDVATFASSLDALYVHIDADILDASLQPNHPTAEPDGLDIDQTLAVAGAAMDAGTVVAFGVVSVDPAGDEGAVSLQSGLSLISGGVARWLRTGNTV